MQGTPKGKPLYFWGILLGRVRETKKKKKEVFALRCQSSDSRLLQACDLLGLDVTEQKGLDLGLARRGKQGRTLPCASLATLKTWGGGGGGEGVGGWVGALFGGYPFFGVGFGRYPGIVSEGFGWRPQRNGPISISGVIPFSLLGAFSRAL